MRFALIQKLFLLVLAGMCLRVCPCFAQVEPSSVTMTVNFATVLGSVNQNAAGILHSISTPAPPDEMIRPLKLRNFRGRAMDHYLTGPGFYERLKRLGFEHVQVVISDNYGYPSIFGWPPDNWGWWDYVAGDVVQKCKSRNMVVEYDIWNEPNINYFWQKSQAEWFETWRRGYVKVRSIDPQAVIVGPSISGFSFAYLTEFLLYARENGCLPDIISWHELGSRSGRNIPGHVSQLQDWLTSNSIMISRFSINEIIPANQALPNDFHDSPGVAVAYFAGIARTPVESACRSCWSDLGGDNGENRSLDGLLTHDTKEPRSTWWAYKAYADLTGELVELTRDAGSTFLDGLATRDSRKGSASVLLGSYETTRALHVNLQVLNLNAAPYLINGDELFVVTDRLAYGGKTASAGPERVFEGTVPVTGNEVRLPLPDLDPKSVYIVRILPVASARESTWLNLGDNGFLE